MKKIKVKINSKIVILDKKEISTLATKKLLVSIINNKKN